MFALLFNISGIAAITSTVFTVIYLFVLISHLKLFKEIGGNKFVVIVNLIIISGVFILLLYFQWVEQKNVFYGSVITFALSFIAEYFYRKFRNREFKMIKFRLPKKIFKLK